MKRGKKLQLAFGGTFVESYQGIKSVRMEFDARSRLSRFVVACTAVAYSAMLLESIVLSVLGAGIGSCLNPKNRGEERDKRVDENGRDGQWNVVRIYTKPKR